MVLLIKVIYDETIGRGRMQETNCGQTCKVVFLFFAQAMRARTMRSKWYSRVVIIAQSR